MSEKAVTGDMRYPAGKAQIYSGIQWLDYPKGAAELIELAYASGWGVDDGLPAGVREDGTVFIRVLIGRESGPDSDAFQFHVTWQCVSHVWTVATVYLKRGSTGRWEGKTPLGDVRKTVSRYPVEETAWTVTR